MTQDRSTENVIPLRRPQRTGAVRHRPGTLALAQSEGVNFGDLPPQIDTLLQQGVIAHRRDPAEAEKIFRKALDTAPDELATYFCLYKIHTYSGRLTEALDIAERGLKEAARQAGWDADWRSWRSAPIDPDGPARFALYTLKALAFIRLKRDERLEAQALLSALARLDPKGLLGWPVVAALAEKLA